MDETRVPVIAAAGQSIERDETVTTAELCERAARAAMGEAPGLAGRIQRVTVISSVFSASSPRAASELAEALGLPAGERETTTVGGNTPQWLVTRAAEQIAMGELTATLVAGAESTRSARAAGSTQRVFRPAAGDDGPADPVVGAAAEGLLSPAEIAIGLFAPAHLYPLFESVLADRAGRDFAEQRRFLGTLMAPFTEVAAGNPYAWFPQQASAEELATRDRATGSRPSPTRSA